MKSCLKCAAMLLLVLLSLRPVTANATAASNPRTYRPSAAVQITPEEAQDESLAAIHAMGAIVLGSAGVLILSNCHRRR